MFEASAAGLGSSAGVRRGRELSDLQMAVRGNGRYKPDDLLRLAMGMGTKQPEVRQGYTV